MTTAAAPTNPPHVLPPPRLNRIDKYAFRGLTALESLNLSGNNLHEIDSGLPQRSMKCKIVSC